MKQIFFTTILILCAFQGPASAQAQSNPAGTYSISRGVSANNSEYTGKVTVEDRGGGAYYLYWRLPNAEETRGIGILDHSTLAFAYSSVPDYGLVIYKVEGGKLSGKWFTTKTESAFGFEDLEGPAGLNGTYQIVAAQAGDFGNSYSGTVEIHPNGEVYQLSWYVSDDVLTGVGLLKGDYLIAGWGTEAGVGYYEMKDNELLGTWASTGANRTGVENLVRISPVQNSTIVARVTTASPITFEELAKRIEGALAKINTMTYDEVLRYRPSGADNTQNKDLIKDKCWYKKPGSHRSESVTLYLPSGPENHVYVGKLEGGNYNSYELLNDGSIQKNSFKAEEWESITPGRFYTDIKKRIKEGSSYSLEVDQNRNIYIVKFSSADEAVFEISGISWLPYSLAVFDQKNNSIVETIRSNIQINPELPDELFRIPEGIEKK